MKTIYNRIIQTLFAPIRCVVCCIGGSYLCVEHEKYLLGYPSCCQFCQTPTIFGQNCDEHQDSDISGLVVGFYYTRIIKYMIHKAKYGGSYHLFSYFAQKLSLLIQLSLCEGFYKNSHRFIITYIPMYYKKELYKRGYNQSEKLARYLSTQLDIPCVPLLEKIQPTTPQMQKSRKDRTKLSPHVYTIIPNKIPPNTIILLVDDIVTTGSTFQTTSSVIKSFFPTNPIRGVCIARNK